MEVLVLVGGEHVGPVPSSADNSCVSVVTAVLPAARYKLQIRPQSIFSRIKEPLIPKLPGSHRARQGEGQGHRRVHVASILLITIGIATVLAACGSSARSSSTAGSGSYSQAVTFANCMRSHEVPYVPDPSADGHFPPGYPKPQVRQSPAYQAAMKACRRLAPSGFGQPTHLSASQRQAALRFAHCMRTHGVPQFPDPTFSPPSTGGPSILVMFNGAAYVQTPPEITHSPAFTHTGIACGARSLR